MSAAANVALDRVTVVARRLDGVLVAVARIQLEAVHLDSPLQLTAVNREIIYYLLVVDIIWLEGTAMFLSSNVSFVVSLMVVSNFRANRRSCVLLHHWLTFIQGLQKTRFILGIIHSAMSQTIHNVMFYRAICNILRTC